MTDSSRHQCALTHASTIQQQAAAMGFDWTRPRDALEKVREETDEVAKLLAHADSARHDSAGLDSPGPGSVRVDSQRHDSARHDPARLREELGDLLFAAVNVARLAGIDPAAALAHATRKFERRFREVERLARRRGLPMPGTPLEPLDRIWDEVKAGEAAGLRSPPTPGKPTSPPHHREPS